jgi:hypothetical protein
MPACFQHFRNPKLLSDVQPEKVTHTHGLLPPRQVTWVIIIAT